MLCCSCGRGMGTCLRKQVPPAGTCCLTDHASFNVLGCLARATAPSGLHAALLAMHARMPDISCTSMEQKAVGGPAGRTGTLSGQHPPDSQHEWPSCWLWQLPALSHRRHHAQQLSPPGYPYLARGAADAAGAAKPAVPVPAAASDRVAEAAMGCLLALLRGAFAIEPWDAPAGDGARVAAGAGHAGAAAEHGAAAGAGAELWPALEQGRSADAAAEAAEPGPASPGPADPGPVPAPGVLVDLLQRVAALADLGPSHAAEEVHHTSSRKIIPCQKFRNRT